MNSHDITGILIVLGTAVVLPISIISLYLRNKMKSENNKKEIILAALEKNAYIDIEELVRKMNAPDKLLKEKLLRKLQWGMLLVFLGLVFIGFAVYLAVSQYGGKQDIPTAVIIGLAFLAVGSAFIVNFYVGKKMLAKEIDAEEQNLQQEK